MPRKESKLSYTLIRNVAEQFEWLDSDGKKHMGINPPADAKDINRVPFFIKYITKDGKVESGHVVCISVDAKRLQRKIKYVESGEIRVVNDLLVMEINGTKYQAH